MFLLGGRANPLVLRGTGGGPTPPPVPPTVDALHVVGTQLENELDEVVVLRGVNTEGVANFQFYSPGGPMAYLNRIIATDDDGGLWLPKIVRLCFERYPCADPGRLYQAGDPRIPYCIPDTSQFPDWPANTAVVEGAVYRYVPADTRYSAQKRYWRADMGWYWNPGHYNVGDRVTGLPIGGTNVYECTAFHEAMIDPAPWAGGPTGTSTTPQVDAIGNTWVYVGQWGTTGATQPFSGTPVHDYYGTWYQDNLMLWGTVGPDLTPAEADAAWANWVTTILDPTVTRCIENGLYVFICDFDFGPADLPLRTARMMEFWDRLSQSQWANHANVMFNLWNESEDVGSFSGWTWTNQKPYIQACVDLIRANGADNVILVTTPAYCAFTYLAVADPLTGTNLLYDCHLYSDYYAGTGNDTNLSLALTYGKAVFCGEFGANQEDNTTVVDTFLNDLMGRIEVSRGSPHPAAGWCAWAFTDDWNPHFFNNSSLTDPSYYGTSIRNLLHDLPAPVTGIVGASGVWTNVTPAGIYLSINVTGSPNWTGWRGTDAFGVGGTYNDPAHANVIYTGADNQGFWKSTDYGGTWARVNTGSGGSALDGFSWGTAVSADGSIVWASNGYGTVTGAYKSTNGGVAWTLSKGADINVIIANQFNSLNALATPHGSTGDTHYYETVDGGANWTDIGANAVGISSDGHFLNSNTVILMSPTGLWQGVKSGSWTWTHVYSMSGPHGGVTMYPDVANGYFYVGGQDTGNIGIIVRCPISGGGANGTWVLVHSTGGSSYGPSSIVGTPNYIYAQGTYALHGTYGPISYRVTPAAAGTNPWPTFSLDAAMTNGAHKLVAVTDGTRWAIVGSNVNAGLWRWIE